MLSTTGPPDEPSQTLAMSLSSLFKSAQTGPDGELNCSSTSPTETSASDISNNGFSAADMLSLLTSNLQKQDFPLIKQEPTPTEGNNSLLQFSQLLQAQQAIAQLQRQATPLVQPTPPSQAPVPTISHNNNNNNNNNNGGERKRSYPCTFQFCVICQKDVHSSKLPCHIRQCHVAKPMFQCPACDFTSTYSKNNVKSHMVSLHGLAGDPISYMDKYASQVEEFMKLCFPNVRGRGRPMQGRSSPKSPISPPTNQSRRASQVGRRGIMQQPTPVLNPTDLLAFAQQQHAVAQQFNAFRNFRFNPLQAMFPVMLPPHMNNNNNNNQNEDVKPTSDEDTGSKTRKLVSSLDDYLRLLRASKKQENLQFCQAGDESQPRYLSLPFLLLSENQRKNTIFDGDCKENLDENEEIISDFNITAQQKEIIDSVRTKVQARMFEVMFAIHRLDFATLGVELISMVREVTPTPIDIALLRMKERRQPETIGDTEQFLLTLARIDRLEEKIESMLHIANFKSECENVEEVLKRQQTLCQAILGSRFLRRLICKLSEIVGKSINSRIGFPISQLGKVLAQEDVTPAILNIQNDEIDDFQQMREVLADGADDLLETARQSLSRLEVKNNRAEVELETSGNQALLIQFSTLSNSEMTRLRSFLENVEDDYMRVLQYCGERLPRHPSLAEISTVTRQIEMLMKKIESCNEDDLNISI